jgi:hypothetical protein
MALREKGGMWCERCQQPVVAHKMGRRVRNTASVVGAVPTLGASLLFAKSDVWHCSVCGGPVTTYSGQSGQAHATRVNQAPNSPPPPAATRAPFQLKPPDVGTGHVCRAEGCVKAPANASVFCHEHGRKWRASKSGDSDAQTAADPISTAEEPNLADGLEKLAKLKATGALSDDEYEAAKRKLLS